MTAERRVEVAAEALHLDYCREARCAGPEPDDYNAARAVVAALDAHDNRVLADLLVARYGKERTLAWLRPDDGAPPLTQFEALCRVAEGAALDAHDGDLRERLAGAVEAAARADAGAPWVGGLHIAARIIRNRP